MRARERIDLPARPRFEDRAPIPDEMRGRLTDWERHELDHAWREAERAARKMTYTAAGILGRLHQGGGLATHSLIMGGDGVPHHIANQLTVKLAEYNTRLEHIRHRISLIPETQP